MKSQWESLQWPICSLQSSGIRIPSTRRFHGAILDLMWLKYLSVSLFLAVCTTSISWAETRHNAPLSQLLKLAGVTGEDITPDKVYRAASPTRDQQLPLFRHTMAQPLEAPYRVGMLAQSYNEVLASPHALIGSTGALSGLRVDRSPETALVALEARLRASADPLAASLTWIAPLAKPPGTWSIVVPDQAQLPDPFRFEIAMVLATMGQSHQFLRRALARIPADATPTLLRRQALDGDIQLFDEPDYRQLLPLLDREALMAGMLDLVAVAERFKRFVTTAELTPMAWTMDTPLGQIAVDTTGQNNRYKLRNPLLMLDVGGDDDYEFLPRNDGHPISLLLDHGGNDRYHTIAPAADPSSATLGYGILWDTEGNDHYQGTQQAQASALFGVALLIDGGGDNQFVARSHAQGHAIGGSALLLSGAGNDTFTAQTHAQGSAGTLGVAVLLDPAGNDRYTLNNLPLIRPSPQLPDRNTSMGQGAGRGIRADALDARSMAGGIGILMDFSGNDQYTAQVFAQGAGYQQGLGLLVDDGGDDHFEAAWYAMGASAHQGAGVLLKRGVGNDHYRVSHSTSLGAAHDFSVGVFLDEGGDDSYALGDLGLGAAHDNSVALFLDGGGDDHYAVATLACRALGASIISGWGDLRESFLNLGLFMDLGGSDSYPASCERGRNNATWPSPRFWSQLNLRSEAGAGFDGELPLPFAIRPRTQHRMPPKQP